MNAGCPKLLSIGSCTFVCTYWSSVFVDSDVDHSVSICHTVHFNMFRVTSKFGLYLYMYIRRHDSNYYSNCRYIV